MKPFTLFLVPYHQSPDPFIIQAFVVVQLVHNYFLKFSQKNVKKD
jgi:hypothetical protein